MTCRDLIELLAEYVDGELSAQRARALERHLEDCDSCRRYLVAYRETGQAVRDAFAEPDPQLPEEVVRAILDARKRGGAK